MANTDHKSPIYENACARCRKCKSVLLLKEVFLGYAGIDNDLFYKENTDVVRRCEKNDRRYNKKFIN